MRRVAQLTAVQNCILEQIARVQFATQKQLMTWCGVNATSISTSVRGLIESGLIDGSLLSRPQLFHLTSAGARLVNVQMPAGGRHASWSVMAHACHLNDFEILFSKSHSGFRMVSRLALLKQGLNPAHGEHAAVDAEKKTWFILLDDYIMGSDRISRSWERRHTPNQKYWPDPTGRAFNELAHHYLVVTTDPYQAERHNAWIEKAGLPAEVLTIPALWKT
jgi:predicted transcriptional regulator